MSFPKYESYKDSGIEWLGELPRQWDILPVFAVAPERHELNTGMLESNLLSLSYGKIVRKDINSNDGLLPESFETYQIVRPGDIVWRLTDLQNDKRSLRTAIVNETGIITSAYLCTISKILDSKYLNYLLRHYDSMKVFYSMGGGLRQSMKYSDVKRIPLIAPSGHEQVTIAAFLDGETAKIDALIDEQKRLIELLKEKRQAVISRAVTKGLDPNVPLKDSGMEWLGEIPAHWEASEIKRHCVKITDGAHISPETENGIYCFVSTKDVGEIGINFDGCLLTSEASYEYLVRTGCRPEKGDVLFSKDGTIGRTVVIQEDREFVVASSLIIIRPDNRTLNSLFLHFLCQSAFVRSQVQSYVKGAGLPRLSIQNLLKVVGVFPSEPEQRKIAEFLASVTSSFDSLIAEAASAIDLLFERRSSIISAAVTGKIDVRDQLPARVAAE